MPFMDEKILTKHPEVKTGLDIIHFSAGRA